MERSIHFISNPNAIVPTGGPNYDEQIGLNLKNFGQDIGGNWNEPDVDYTGSNTISSDLNSLNDGTATGISATVSDPADSSDISGDTTSSTASFPAKTYDRGARVANTAAFAVKFSGFTANTEIKARVALFVTTSVFATEDGTLGVTNGGTATTINCTSPVEYEFESTADGNGDFIITLTADSGATNGVGMCGIILDYVS